MNLRELELLELLQLRQSALLFLFLLLLIQLISLNYHLDILLVVLSFDILPLLLFLELPLQNLLYFFVTDLHLLLLAVFFFLDLLLTIECILEHSSFQLLLGIVVSLDHCVRHPVHSPVDPCLPLCVLSLSLLLCFFNHSLILLHLFDLLEPQLLVLLHALLLLKLVVPDDLHSILPLLNFLLLLVIFVLFDGFSDSIYLLLLLDSLLLKLLLFLPFHFSDLPLSVDLLFEDFLLFEIVFLFLLFDLFLSVLQNNAVEALYFVQALLLHLLLFFDLLVQGASHQSPLLQEILPLLFLLFLVFEVVVLGELAPHII